MNNKKMIQRVAKQTGLSVATVAPIINVFTSVIEAKLLEGEDVQLGRIGKLSPTLHQKKAAHNVNTGVLKPLAYYSIKYVPSASMRTDMRSRAKFLSEFEEKVKARAKTEIGK